MANQKRSRAPERGAGARSGRRLPPKVRPDIPLMPIVVGGILVVVASAIVAYAAVNRTAPPTAGTIKCDSGEQTQVHYHAGLQILYQGNPIKIPTNIGRTATCFYWLHMHDDTPGVIHVESPTNEPFTLGQFFDVWAKSTGTPEPLDSTHVSSFTLSGGQQLVTFVDLGDGKGPSRYAGDPRGIVIKAHEVITLEITPPTVDPPPSFKFPTGL